MSLLFAAGAVAAQPIAFTGVHVVDVAAGVTRAEQTVVVDGGWIAAAGPSAEVAIPDGATRIDGRGQYLIPGLWEMHAHTSSDRITREVVYPLFVANGVTGIRNMNGDCFESGAKACFPLHAPIGKARVRRGEVVAGTLVGPREVDGSTHADGPPRGQPSSVQAAGTPEHARAFVRLEKERGVDFIKPYDGIPREAYFALADEAKRLGLPLAGHVPVAVRASEASDAGQRSIEHVGGGNVLEECSAREGELRPRVVAELASEEPDVVPLMALMMESHDAEKCAALFTRLVANGTWVAPTLRVAPLPGEPGGDWMDDPRLRYVPREEREFFVVLEQTTEAILSDAETVAPYARWIREITGRMHRAGVRLLAGSDAGSPGILWGFSLHEELELLVAAGLSPAAALRAATLGPAEYFGWTDSLGTVEAGKEADLVLLAANPLEAISNTQKISAVVARGRLFDRPALDAMLADAERRAAR